MMGKKGNETPDEIKARITEEMKKIQQFIETDFDPLVEDYLKLRNRCLLEMDRFFKIKIKPMARIYRERCQALMKEIEGQESLESFLEKEVKSVVETCDKQWDVLQNDCMRKELKKTIKTGNIAL